MVRVFCRRAWPLAAAALLLWLALSLRPARAGRTAPGEPETRDAFFSMLFPQLFWREATPGEAVCL